MGDRLDSAALRQLEVLVPHLKRRLSGVTSSLVRLVPLQARRLALATVGVGLDATAVSHLRLRDLWRLPRRGPRGARVWHARRNREMVLGLLLRHGGGWQLRLLFTSASQRRHTRLSRWLIRRMDAVIATSPATAAYLQRPALVIPHGIDPQVFCPVVDRRAVRQALGLPLEAVLVGCFGRLRAQKGTDVCVEALLPLLARDPRLHLLLLGRTTRRHRAFRRALEQRLQASPDGQRVHLLPEVPVAAVVPWYQALDLYVAPQRWEGFGLTVLEAMACGLPVVATQVGAFARLVEPGSTGLLVTPGDRAALEEAVGRLLADPALRERMGQQGRRRVCQHHGLELEAQRLHAVYEALLAGRDPLDLSLEAPSLFSEPLRP